MSLKRSGWMVLPALAGAAVGCAGRQTVGERASDSWIGAQVESKLAANGMTNALDIDVDTTDGVVELRGVVGSEAERHEALQVARSVKGVREVEDHLEIGDLRLGDRVADSEITAEIKSKLIADSTVDAGDIDVDTISGKVTLSGFVETEDEKEEAEALVRTVAGVRDVENELRVDTVP